MNKQGKLTAIQKEMEKLGMTYTKCKTQGCEFYSKENSEYCYQHYAPVLTIDDYRNAIDATSACNVSGLIRQLSEITERIWNCDKQHGIGTYFVNHHPIIQLYAYQIAYLSHNREPIEWEGFSDAYKYCKSVVEGAFPPEENWMLHIHACYHGKR